jgi:outer membrane receptor for ferrienterochelin and colicins
MGRSIKVVRGPRTLTLLPLLLLSLLSLFHLPAPAAAAAPEADEAQFRFLRGNSLYRQGRFEEALSEYYLSDRLVPNRNVEFNIARCLEKLRRFDEAFRAWSALDADGLAEAERALLRESIDRLRPQLALLRIDTEPPGAEIYLGRRDLGSLGQTPKLIAVPEGKATLVLDLDGHRPAEVPVEPQRGKEQVIAIKLDRVFGRVLVTGIPETSVVKRDSSAGELLRVGTGEVRLPPGDRAIHISAPGHEPTRIELRVVADTAVTLPVALRPMQTGSIVVRSNVEGALVKIDGREAGFTPLVLEKVALGTRVIEAQKDGYQGQQAEVEVRETAPAYLDLRMRAVAPQVSGATKDLVAAAEAPASITVITAEEIAAFGYTTLADALAGVRGAYSSDDRIYPAVGFRGFSPPGDYTNRVLILVDGHPTNEVLTGQGFVGRGFDVDLGNVERIEIARGPGSVLYGTGALFGVVNVVTRRPPPGVHAAAGVQGGTLGLAQGRVTASARGDAGEMMASAAGMEQVGDRRFAWEQDAAGAGAPVAINADREQAGHADLRARVGPFSLQAWYNERSKRVPTGAFDTRPDGGTLYRDVRAFVELRAEKNWRALQLWARAAFDESRFEGTYRLRPDASGQPRPDLGDRFLARWLAGELRLETPLAWRQRLTVGGELQYQFELDLGPPSVTAQQAAGATSELVVSGYAVDEVVLAPWLRASAGLRVDYYPESFGTTLNPRLAVIARPYREGNTKLLLGRAFRAPSPYERFYNDGGVTQRQAGRLVPESVLAGELEHAHTLGNELALAGSLFAHELSDLIVLEEDSPAGGQPGPLVYRNGAARVRSLGGDVELRWEPQAGTLLAGAFTLSQVRSLEGGRVAYFPNAPQALAALRWLYPMVPERLRLGSEIQLDTGRRTRDELRLEDALIWNITLSGAYAPWRIRYFAGLFNLFDIKDRARGYPVGAEVPASTVPRYGRSARIGLQLAM